MPAPILQIEDLTIEYRGRSRTGRKGALRAVDGVSIELAAGELIALVGESGSGKSSVANAVLGLVPPASGRIVLHGVEISALRGRRARAARRTAQLIMQDPYESLDPHLTILQLVEEPLIVHRLERSAAGRRERVLRTLAAVGLTPAESFLDRRPHELSGGQRQRVCIAAALIVEPALLVADEPVSMLDVSVRAGVLHLLDGVRADGATSVLMITHDLPTAAAFCDRIVVMHDGAIVEQGPARTVVHDPKHDYTRALLAATPKLDRASATRER